MKRILLILMLLLFAGTTFAQMQQGIVKTRGRVVNGQVVPGKMLSGATITLSLGNPQVSQAQGTFSFNVPAGKSYSLVSAKKQGYTLADPEYTRRTFKFSASNPFYVVLEDEAQRQADIKEATDKVRKTLKRELRKREDELDELRESNAITQAKYDSLRIEFATYRQSSEALVNEMAQRFAVIDYDQLDEFNRQVQQYIEEGELLKADSLINTRGSLEERYARVKEQENVNTQREEEIRQQQETLAKSQELTQREKEDLMSDLYAKHTIYLQAYQQDSALYCLKMRADLDTTNVKAAWDYAQLACVTSNYDESEKYFLRCADLCVRNGDLPNLAICYNQIGVLYGEVNDFVQSENYLKLALSNYEVLFNLDPDAYYEELANTQNNLGGLYLELRNYTSSETYLKLALSSYETVSIQNPNADNIGMVHTLLSLGILYWKTHNYDSSKQYLLSALTNIERLFNIRPEDYRLTMANVQDALGVLYNEIGEYCLSEKYLLLSLSNKELLFKEFPAEYRDDLAKTQMHLGVLYSHVDDGISADYLEQALENFKLLFSHSPNAYRDDLAAIMLNLGIHYCEHLDFDKSENYLSLALEHYEQLSEQKPEAYLAELAKVQFNLGSLYSRLDDDNNIEKYYSLAINSRERLYNLFPEIYKEDMAKGYLNIMQFYEDRENTEQYEINLNKALILYLDLCAAGRGYDFEVSELLKRTIMLKLDQGNIDDAIDVAMLLIDKYDNQLSREYLAECYNCKALDLANKSMYELAYQTIDEGMSISQEHAYFYDTKGEILLMQGRNDEALAMWKKVLELNPNFLDDYPDGTNLSNGLKKLGLIE